MRRRWFLYLTPVVPAVGDRGVIQPVIHPVRRYFLQALNAGQYQGHFREEQRLAAENSEELEAHRYKNRAHQQEAHHQQRHYVILPASTSATWNISITAAVRIISVSRVR